MQLGLPCKQSQAERTVRSTKDRITTLVFSQRKVQRVCGCYRGGRALSHSPSLLTPVAVSGAHQKLYFLHHEEAGYSVTCIWFAPLQGRLQYQKIQNEKHVEYHSRQM